MTRTRSLIAGLLAVLLGGWLMTSAAPASVLATAVPVPSCVKPTGNPTHLQMVNYAACLQSRTEALIENAHAPAPTVTETVTVSPSPTPTTAPTASPSPTPAPTPTPTPTTAPTSCVKPDGTNTGASGTLATYTGSTSVTANGTVIEDKVVNGSLTIYGDNVTLRNVRVTGALGVDGAVGTNISRTTMREFFISSSQNVTLDRSDITGSITDGMHVTSDGASMNAAITITNNYIHDPRPGEGSHYDGLQVRGVNGLDLLCNNFDLGPAQFEYNAALYLEPANGGHSNVVIDGNWLFGGGHIFHYGDDNDGKTRLTNNHFGGDPYWGPNAVCHTAGAKPSTQTGNDLRGVAFTPCA